jgi:hypothetical protein
MSVKDELVISELSQPHLGFKIGAKVIGLKINDDIYFGLVHDEGDENWGYFFGNKSAVLDETKTKPYTKMDISIFNSLVKGVMNKKIFIPVTELI